MKKYPTATEILDDYIADLVWKIRTLEAENAELQKYIAENQRAELEHHQKVAAKCLTAALDPNSAVNKGARDGNEG